MSSYYSYTITSKKELINKYINIEELKDNILEVKENGESKTVNLNGPSVIFDYVDELIKNAENENILFEYHFTSPDEFDGYNWYERKNSEVKEWKEEVKEEE